MKGKILAWLAKSAGPVLWHIVKDEALPLVKEAAKEAIKAEIQAQIRSAENKIS